MSNPNIPTNCNACSKPLLLENLFVDDGCPCSSERGVNFAGRSCTVCSVPYCVKPGHRYLVALFGEDRVLREGAKSTPPGDDFDQKASHLEGLVGIAARELQDNAAYDGAMHNGGAGVLRMQMHFFNCGRNRIIPPEWAQYAKKLDPEFAEYERLHKKFSDQ